MDSNNAKYARCYTISLCIFNGFCFFFKFIVTKSVIEGSAATYYCWLFLDSFFSQECDSDDTCQRPNTVCSNIKICGCVAGTFESSSGDCLSKIYSHCA